MMSASCLECIVRRQHERIKDYPEDERVKSVYMFDLLGLLARDARDMSPQRAAEMIDQLHLRVFGRNEDMGGLKRKYNQHMLNLLPRLEAVISAAPDPLMSAICHAQAGNYIDFATTQVDDEQLFGLLERAQQGILDERCYRALVKDLEQAKSLMYLCDNAGEIVLDRLLIEQLRIKFPELCITAMVRGAPVLNDVTMDDAEQVGLTQVVPVVTSGSPLAGTELKYMKEDKRRLIECSDVIISKGQGNFETMLGCGLNVYYMLLCKCDWFVKRYGLPKNAPCL